MIKHFAIIILASILCLQMFAADISEDLNIAKDRVSVLYFPNRGLLHGHFKLEIEGHALDWFQGKKNSTTLSKLIASLEKRGARPFFRFIIPVTQEIFEDLRDHAHETEACLCTRGVFDTLAKHGGPQIPLALQFSPLLCGAYCAAAHYCGTGIVEKIEVYASSSTNIMLASLMGMGGELFFMVCLPYVLYIIF